MRILVVGAGLMAGEHIKVLDALKINYTVVGRSEGSAKKFEQMYGEKVLIGGLENVFESLEDNYTHAIIATPLENLEENTLFLLKNGMKNILLEKPGAVTKEGIEQIQNMATANKANVYIAYNRRFYSSIIEAKKRILEDGGLTSFLFEFTEWAHQIVKFNKTPFQLENWFIGNSTHVVDAAFYLGGEPRVLQGFSQNKLDWHPKGSIFVGSGMTVNDIPFSYHANWGAPGSWKLELLTSKNRYIFRPFEQLHVQKIGSVVVDKVELDDQIDIQFKAGLYRQMEQFLFGTKYSELINIDETLRLHYWYKQILNSHNN
ncbi:Gfo/Idh/MocA family oxidoreductase [Lysinibacillus fusiformis]|nr:Gfo/Idh/MocA family oxidoreductase [Lysinibacillus fusiformis]